MASNELIRATYMCECVSRQEYYSQTYCFPNANPTYANGPKNAVFGAVLQEGFANVLARSESTSF